MSAFPDDAVHREREWAAVPPLFRCKYLEEPVDRYTINMDPLMGGRCFNVASGAKRSQGRIQKKSNVDPLDHDWLNLVFSRSPSPNPPVSIWLSEDYQQLLLMKWCTERDAGLSVRHQPKTSSYMVNYEIYRSFRSHWGICMTIL